MAIFKVNLHHRAYNDRFQTNGKPIYEKERLERTFEVHVRSKSHQAIYDAAWDKIDKNRWAYGMGSWTIAVESV